MKKIFAILPCYNEGENIGALIEDWLSQQKMLEKHGYALTIVGIDDKSKDNTKEVILEFAQKYEQVKLVAHEVNTNLGGVIATGFKYFLEHGEPQDVCVVMDGDNTHDPVFVDEMFVKIQNGADCVIASRYCQESKVVGVPGIRKFLSDGARWFYSFVLGVKNVKDYTCGYRMYTYDILNKAQETYGDRFVEQKTFSCMMEVLYKLYKIGCAFDEVYFVLRYDKKEGESKMKVLKTIKDSVYTAIKLRFS